MKILIMEDDEILNDILTNKLISKGYEVENVFDGNEALEEIYKENFDLLILDVNVPRINGFKLLSKLRKDKINIPTIFITSLNDVEDLKKGFNSGCDDYIKKPFKFEELEIRINNIKRIYKIDQNEIIDLGDEVSYNYDTSTILKSKVEYKLTKKTIKIFEYFLKNRKKIITIEELNHNIWTYDEVPTNSTIRTYIKNLRKILGESSIKTIQGVGYQFN